MVMSDISRAVRCIHVPEPLIMTVERIELHYTYFIY